MKVLAFNALLLGLVHVASGHMSIISPCPRYSAAGTSCPKLPSGVSSYDSNVNAPIGTHGGIAQPLCKYKTPWPTVAATWTAGQSVTIKFNPSGVSHSGGNCEFSISYDGGKTFAVIHRELQYCFVGKKPSGTTNTVSVNSYTFNLPADLPSSDKAVFAWSWVNASGNREFYMNCADVAITGSTSTSYTGTEMVIANYGDYPLIEEFKGDYEAGLALYKSAKRITVSPSGTKPADNNVSRPDNGEENNTNGRILAPRALEDEKCDPEVSSDAENGVSQQEGEGGSSNEGNSADGEDSSAYGEDSSADDDKCDTDNESESNPTGDSSDNSDDLGEQCETDESDSSGTPESSESSDDLGEQCEPEDSSSPTSTSESSSESPISPSSSEESSSSPSSLGESSFSPTPTSSSSESSSPSSSPTSPSSSSSSPTITPTTTPAPVVNSNEPGLVCQRPTGISVPSIISSNSIDPSSYAKFEISMPGSDTF
ncbi:hypothetical protein GGH93_002848 [Coemansia aciculifera]|nr:hypothetical protein GGH93_002848 [Coemansia aciculifera]